MLAAPGAFASCNPRAVILAGVAALRAADPDGLAVGVFAWADSETGVAANTRTAAHQRVGFVLPVWGGSIPMRRNVRRLYVRPGYQITMMAAGDFWAFFEGGAEVGAQVHASLLDGAAISGYAADSEPTPWYVATEAPPGGLAIISTWSKPPS